LIYLPSEKTLDKEVTLPSFFLALHSAKMRFPIVMHTVGVRQVLLTPKIGTGKRLTCGPNLVEERHSTEDFP
jgi:hypothetical protein